MLDEDKLRLIEQIKELIAKDELSQACELLKQISDIGYQLQGSLTDLNKRSELNVISFDTYKLEKNRIRLAILNELKISQKSKIKQPHDGLKASQEEVNNWKLLFSNTDADDDHQRAKFILEKWSRNRDYQEIGHRKWREINLRENKVGYRFWGLYNIRARNDKWVWIAWDSQKENWLS